MERFAQAIPLFSESRDLPSAGARQWCLFGRSEVLSKHGMSEATLSPKGFLYIDSDHLIRLRRAKAVANSINSHLVLLIGGHRREAKVDKTYNAIYINKYFCNVM